MAETRDNVTRSFDIFIAAYGAQYPKASENMEKDCEEMLAFYDCPTKHWQSISTTNPIKSSIAPVLRKNA